MCIIVEHITQKQEHFNKGMLNDKFKIYGVDILPKIANKFWVIIEFFGNDYQYLLILSNSQ